MDMSDEKSGTSSLEDGTKDQKEFFESFYEDNADDYDDEDDAYEVWEEEHCFSKGVH